MQPLDIALWHILRDSGPLHGLEIMRRAALELGKQPLPGTLYKVLHRLERDGWVVGFWEDERVTNPHRGPRRRYYRVVGERTPLANPGQNVSLGRAPVSNLGGVS